MQPPLTVGTVLQNRYRIIKTLGQGGFGRTYLAEDQRRFNELCAIKEFTPTVTGAQAWDKAQELFQREAAILYQIQHPQIPQFRERFEQDQRLFLVQDYIAGQTYRALLDERKVSGRTFTETEVLQLMQSLTPVLEYIHNRGIIHRDISPDNIILRDSDRLPVLIDFGVVKELATKLYASDDTIPPTYVGKSGYSPTEQMQTGRAYPSSDLYALAVTAVVLLTAKEPQELFDEHQLRWQWQSWATVHPQFAQVLERMLSYKLSDRYQSAAQVYQALQSVPQPSSSTSHLSNIQTIAVGRRPEPLQPARSNTTEVKTSEPKTNAVIDNPLAIITIALTVIIVAGFGSWILVSYLRVQSRSSPVSTAPQTFPSPVITGETPTPTEPTETPTVDLTETPTPEVTETLTPEVTETLTPEVTETPTPTPPTQKLIALNFDRAGTARAEGILQENEVIRYTFIGQQGLQLTVLLAQESGVLLTVIGPNQEPIELAARQTTFYQGILPFDGSYSIELRLTPGTGASNYNLNVGLEDLAQPTIETPADIVPTPLPTETTPLPSPIDPLPRETPTDSFTPSPRQTSPTDPTLGEEGLSIPN